MRNINDLAICMVDYETDVSVVREFMSKIQFQKLLSEESNIIRFQNLFEITKVHYAFPQAEQRVFGEILEDKSQYPEDTLLQRNLKKYLMDGKNPGIGTGFVKNIYQYI